MLPIIPGVTEFRPANAVPVVCSFLFGPAGAWGAAIGNVIGDFFGGIGPGDLFGFVGNLLYGLVPYKAWEALSDGDPVPRSVVGWLAFLTVVLLASAACALFIGWGINLLGFVPFRVLGNVILFNNGVTSIVLAPLLLAVIYPRVKRGQLRYRDILSQRTREAARRAPPRAAHRRRRHHRRHGRRQLAVERLAAACPSLPAADAAGGTGAAAVGLGLVPVIALLLVGVALL